MASNAVLRWQDGHGWLILAGNASDEIHAMALTRASADGGVAYIVWGGVQSQQAENLLNDLEDLGAPTGYLVDITVEDDTTIQTQLAEAGIIILSGASGLEAMRSGLLGAAVAGIEQALQRGALVLAEGSTASLAGRWMMTESGEIKSGLDWLKDAVVLPNIIDAAEARSSRTVLDLEPSAIAIAIGAGSALALGPNGEVETWGSRQVAIALGRDYGREI